MRAILIMIAAILALTNGDPAFAGLSKRQFQKIEIDGFRVGMSLAEADVVMRHRFDLEEPLSELYAAFNCGALLPKKADGDYENLQNRRYPISYFIDGRNHHLYDLFFESRPTGTDIYSIYYYNFVPKGPWPSHLSFVTGRYGKPDIVRADGPHMSAIWCERGDKKCGADGYRQRLVLNWNPSPNRSSPGSGYIVWERAHRYDRQYEDDYAAIAERDPAKGQMLFKQCMYAADTFADDADLDGHLGNSIAGLSNWSPAISEPRLIGKDLLNAVGFELEGLISSHNCAIRRRAGYGGSTCGDRSEFRWMRSKGPLSLFALRDVGPKSYRTRTGSLTNEKRYYCAVWRQNGVQRIVWAGESLIDFREWRKNNSDDETDRQPATTARRRPDVWSGSGALSAQCAPAPG
jgi:hypothetical protein